MLINPMDVNYQQERLNDMQREAERADLLRQVRKDQVIENDHSLPTTTSSQQWLAIGDDAAKNCQSNRKQWSVSDAS